VDGYVRQGVAAGCKLLCGGKPLTVNPESEGYFYAPTLFDEVFPDSPLAKEEIFGPVLPVIPVPDAETAIRVANDTRYGLPAPHFAHEFAQEFARLETGMVYNHERPARRTCRPGKERFRQARSLWSLGAGFLTTTKAVMLSASARTPA
jgi:acyl-CoA reductase-like NAD-dependent aldehyde dehydrogenase